MIKVVLEVACLDEQHARLTERKVRDAMLSNGMPGYEDPYCFKTYVEDENAPNIQKCQ